MIEKYEDATGEAYEYATKDVMKFGLANGLLMTSMLLCYIPVVLYGSYLVYDNVRKTGCDPSGSSIGNESCEPDGENIFGENALSGDGDSVLIEIAIEPHSLTFSRTKPQVHCLE